MEVSGHITARIWASNPQYPMDRRLDLRDRKWQDNTTKRGASQSINMVIKWRMRWEGLVVRMGQIRNAYKILVSSRQTLWRQRKCEDILTDLRETAWEDVDWMHLAQDRYQWRHLSNIEINLHVPQRMEIFLISGVNYWLLKKSFASWC